MAKTVIAYEDDPALRQQLEHVFYALRDEFHLAATFPDPARVMVEVRAHKPDIVLMDLQMKSDDDGLGALYKIKLEQPEIKVLVLTMFDADQKVFNAICLGADGYMLKSDFSSYQIPHEIMRRSLNTIVNGGAYLTPSVAKQIMNLFSDISILERVQKVKTGFQQLFQKPKGAEKERTSGLTKMQTHVLVGIIDGKTNVQMAREMNLSENTIGSHVKAIYAALGVHSRALAVKKAIENKWIS